METVPGFTTDFLTPKKQAQSRNVEIPTLLHKRQKSLERRKKCSLLEMYGGEKPVWIHTCMLLICQLCLIAVQNSGTTDLFRQFQIWSNVLFLLQKCTIGPYETHPILFTIKQTIFFLMFIGPCIIVIVEE